MTSPQNPTPASKEPASSAAEIDKIPPAPALQTAESAPKKPQKAVKGSAAASTWVALIIGALLLILLLIFILQNQQKVEINFFSLSSQFPAGIAFLIFAIAGALIMALVGGWRMFELRRQVRKAAKN